jgi:hypothetical protein
MYSDRYALSQRNVVTTYERRIFEGKPIYPSFHRYGVGGYIAPHTDGVKYDEVSQRQSTTTFLLYLEDTLDGGETVFLSQVPALQCVR